MRMVNIRSIITGSLASIGLLLSSGCGSLSQEPDTAFSGPLEDPARTLAFWTPTKMIEAHRLPIEGSPGTPALPPITPGYDESGNAELSRPYTDSVTSRITGELFFYDGVRDEVGHCTASVINSRSKRLLITPAHCVLRPEGEVPVWFLYPLFVPAYDGSLDVTDAQRAPYGLWPVQRAYVSGLLKEKPYMSLSTLHDLAVVAVFDQLGSQPIETVVGTGFSVLANDAGAEFPMVGTLGYPGVEPYAGANQWWCKSRIKEAAAPDLNLQHCYTPGGYSGAPIVVLSEESATPDGTGVVGVVHARTSQARLRSGLINVLLEAANLDNP